MMKKKKKHFEVGEEETKKNSLVSLSKKKKEKESLFLSPNAHTAMASNVAEVPASYSKNLCACIGCHLVKTKDQVRGEGGGLKSVEREKAEHRKCVEIIEFFLFSLCSFLSFFQIMPWCREREEAM